MLFANAALPSLLFLPDPFWICVVPENSSDGFHAASKGFGDYHQKRYGSSIMISTEILQDGLPSLPVALESVICKPSQFGVQLHRWNCA
jgi:hypothetical protein